MRTIAFTTVTIGEAWETLESTTREELTRWLQRYDPESLEYEQALQTVQASTSLSPATGRVVAVGVQDVERDVGVVYTDFPAGAGSVLPADWQLRSGDEATMLSWFWNGVARYQVVASFAGRSFGLPFLAHRAIRYDITPVRALFGRRRLAEQQSPYHVDLQDELSYYGAMQKRLSLPLWCRTYNIDIPYSSVRADVAAIHEWYAVADVTSLTQHVVAKLQATSALYHRWSAHLAPVGWTTGNQT